MMYGQNYNITLVLYRGGLCPLHPPTYMRLSTRPVVFSLRGPYQAPSIMKQPGFLPGLRVNSNIFL